MNVSGSNWRKRSGEAAVERDRAGSERVVVELDDAVGSELVGPGDVICPMDADGEYEPLAIDKAWRIARPAELAVMDTRFAQCIGR